MRGKQAAEGAMGDRGPHIVGVVAVISVEGGRASARQRRRNPSSSRQANLPHVSAYMRLDSVATYRGSATSRSLVLCALQPSRPTLLLYAR